MYYYINPINIYYVTMRGAEVGNEINRNGVSLQLPVNALYHLLTFKHIASSLTGCY
jgi:hypothetical protein